MKKVYIRKSQIHGKGVFSKESMKKGERILKIDDSRIVTKTNPLDPQKGEFEQHCDYLPDGQVILMQPPECFINHSCEPNSYIKRINNIRIIYTLQEIVENEEITFDYCIDGEGETIWECNCGRKRYRKTIHSSFFQLPIELQLKYVPLLTDSFKEKYAKKIEELKKKYD